LDSTGAVLIEAAPVKFFAHRATVRKIGSLIESLRVDNSNS